MRQLSFEGGDHRTWPAAIEVGSLGGRLCDRPEVDGALSRVLEVVQAARPFRQRQLPQVVDERSVPEGPRTIVKVEGAAEPAETQRHGEQGRNAYSAGEHDRTAGALLQKEVVSRTADFEPVPDFQ